MESSKEESKEVSKESSKDTSKESSKTSSNETSKEVSKESSKETSKENSKTSSNESSKEVSKESSKETPKETSKTSSSTSQSTSNSSSNYVFNNFSKEQIIRYGRLLEEFTRSYKGVEEIIPANSLVGIVDFNEENCAIYYNGFLIPSKIQFVEIFPEDYVPDFSDPNWIGLDK